MSFGVDYSFSRPKPADLKAAGVTFVLRYLMDGKSGKDLTYSECRALNAVGIKTGVVFESSAGRAAQGKAAGIQDAKTAARLMKGLRDDAPIYFAVDFQPSAAQTPAVLLYFAGVSSVIGIKRTGAYGGIDIIDALFRGSLISLGWQTTAWSNGKWSKKANLRQYKNGQQLAGATVDFDSWVDPSKDAGLWVLHEFDKPATKPPVVKPPLTKPPVVVPPVVTPKPPVTPPTHPFPLGAGHVYGYKPKHLAMAILGRCHDGSANRLDFANVAAIQRRFKRIPTGRYSLQLHADVLKWQKKFGAVANGVKPNGVVDAPTWKALGL